MAFTSTKNRRRADTAERTAAVKATASRVMPVFAKVTVLLAVLVGLSFGSVRGWQWLHTAPRFAIQRISFIGLSRVAEADLLRLAALGSGQNLFALDVGQTERAMASHPWVQKIEISRRLPDGLSIEVVEHGPAALLALGDLYLVNEDGHSFRRVQPGDSLDLLLITGLDRDAYVEDTNAAAAKVAEAIRVARAYEASPAGKQVALSEARLEPAGVALISARGEELRLGEGELEAKFERLARVRAELSARELRAEVIHLDNRARPDWVAVKVWDSGSERTRVP